MPAAAVIPAPIAYIKVVAVKKLVVGFRNMQEAVHRNCEYRACISFLYNDRPSAMVDTACNRLL